MLSATKSSGSDRETQAKKIKSKEHLLRAVICHFSLKKTSVKLASQSFCLPSIEVHFSFTNDFFFLGEEELIKQRGKEKKNDVGKTYCIFANPSIVSNHKSGLQAYPLIYIPPPCSILPLSTRVRSGALPAGSQSITARSCMGPAEETEYICFCLALRLKPLPSLP